MKTKPRRFLVPNDSSGDCPPVAIYHAVTRIVDRRFVLGADEKENLRRLLRMYEKFSGCRVLSYCLLSNHLHVLLEVPPGCGKGESLGLSDEELLRRISGLYSRNFTESVRREIEEARALIVGEYEGVGVGVGVGELTEEERARDVRLGTEALEVIHVRYSYRMHSLSEFFKGLLQRFTCWFNRTHERKGVLWESRFRSVIVEDGLAARTMAAYIDLNPVRAGICEDPADYRWSSYGEAVGGGRGAKKAQMGLVRALNCFGSREVSERSWAQGGVRKEYRRILISAGVEQGEERGNVATKQRVITRKGMSREMAEAELERLSEEKARDMKISKVVRCRVRYFTHGAVIGSKDFVNGVFRAGRERFGPKRKDGARRPKGPLGEMAGELWSLRDLKADVP